MPCIYVFLKQQQTCSDTVDQTVLEIARAMVECNIGAVPVLEDGRLVGIFSERDLLRRVVVEGRDAGSTRVREVMTPNPLTVDPHEDAEACRQLMGRHGFRHLPVCDGGELKGMISLRDLLLHGLDEREEEVRMMRAYIQTGP
jgi:CBS domain-containing protein